MGLGLMTRSPIPRTGILRRAINADEVFDRIETAVRSAALAKEGALGRFLSFNRCTDPDTNPLLELLLHPCAEAVEFRVSGKQVVVSAKTSTVGPGYHAAVVSIIDEIGKAGFEWDWTEDDDSSGDETGYATHRNFSQLQQSMAEFFGNLMRIVDEQVFDDSNGTACVNVQINARRPTGMAGMVFPLGVRPRAWCVAASKAPELYAPEFFAWWSAGLDAPFWLKTALCVMWVDIDWHPPASEKQRHVQTLAVLCLSRAKSLDPAIALPQEELDELKRLLATGTDDAVPPHPSGIGFARLVCTQPLPAGWHIDLPGYFYFEQEPDGTVAWYFGERTVRVSIYSFKPKEGAAPDEEPFIPEDLRVRKQIGAMVYATKEVVPSEDEQGWLVNAVGAVPGKLALITVAFVDRADEDWARRVSETIRPPGGIGG